MVQNFLYLSPAETNPVHVQNQAGALLRARWVPVSTGQGWAAGES